MTLHQKPMGSVYQTNCYILTKGQKSLIIDPGMGATQWAIDNAPGAVAILNTHGHFDHVWSNSELQEKLKIPVYIRAEDEPMLRVDPYSMGLPPSRADVLVKDEEWIDLEGFRFRFVHMPGHTPGCSMIEFEEMIFTGDFIFDGAVGRSDFPASNPAHMRHSIERFMREYTTPKTLYPGHGPQTDALAAAQFLPRFIQML